MKKGEPKKNEKVTLEKLASLIEKLAVFTVNGFEELRQGQAKLEQRQEKLEQRQEKLEQRQEKLEQGQGGLREEIAFLKEEQKETNRCLRLIERKQVGTLTSLDETVHRNEFNKLARRVEALEA